IGSHNAWTRDTAQRLLVERQDKSVVPALVELAAEGASPVARVHALWTLSGLSALTPDTTSSAQTDPSADIRVQAIVLLREHSRSEMLADQLLTLVRDPAPSVRFQVALAVGDLDSPAAISVLAALARQGAADEWQRLAVLSGLGR